MQKQLKMSDLGKADHSFKPDKNYRFSDFAGRRGSVIIKYRVCLTEFEPGSFEVLSTQTHQSGIAELPLPRSRKHFLMTDQRLFPSHVSKLYVAPPGQKIVRIRKHIFVDCSVFIRFGGEVLKAVNKAGFLCLKVSDKNYCALKKQTR
jgi:hypothetical protein